MTEALINKIPKLTKQQKDTLVLIKNHHYFRAKDGWRKKFVYKKLSLRLVNSLKKEGLITEKETQYSIKLALTPLGDRAVNIITGKSQG